MGPLEAGQVRTPTGVNHLVGIEIVNLSYYGDTLAGSAGRDIVNGSAGFTVMFTEQDIDKPGDRWVFIDENEKGINDGFFAVDMVGGTGLLDSVSVRHRQSYGMGFADGHGAQIKLHDARTLTWTGVGGNAQVVGNQDWFNLTNYSTYK